MVLDKNTSIENRLAAVESKLGISQLPQLTSSSKDIENRIDDVYEKYVKKIQSHSNGSLVKDLKTCETLEKELNPGLLLTHQISSSSTKSAPLLYRRQDILSCKESFKKDMDELTKIRDLLVLKQISGKSKSEPNFADSPIISCSAYRESSDPAMTQRLNAVVTKVSVLQSKASSLSSRLDVLLNQYHNIISNTSEKIVLANEELHQIEKERT